MNRFGSEEYAEEELVAELGAAFLCSHLQVPSRLREDHAAYIKSWIRILKEDKRAIFTASDHRAEWWRCWRARAKDWVIYAKPPFGGPEAVLSQAIHVHGVSPANM